MLICAHTHAVGTSWVYTVSLPVCLLRPTIHMYSRTKGAYRQGNSRKPRLHYTRRDAKWRDAIWRDIQVLFTLCATSSRAVTWQQGIWDPEQIKWCNLNGCFDPTWQCVYLTDIPPKITSIRITQPHKHITWNTNSSHWWVLIKVCWGVNPVCVNSTSHVTLNRAS